MMNDKKLNDIVNRCAYEYGYEEASAEFSPLSELKVKWQRDDKWINMQVSDYLLYAPESVIELLIRAILGKIRGEATEDSPVLAEYFEKSDFRSMMRGTYLSRHMAEDAPDDVIGCLNKACERLNVDPRSLDIVVFSSPEKDRMTSVSVLFRAIHVNPDFRRIYSEEVYATQLTHAIARCLCRIIAGWCAPDEKFEKLWRRYVRKYVDPLVRDKIDEILDRTMEDYQLMSRIGENDS